MSGGSLNQLVALKDVVRAALFVPRSFVAFVTIAVVSMLGYAISPAYAALLLATLPFEVLVLGYMISVAHAIVLGQDDGLPPFRPIETQVRRGLVGSILLMPIAVAILGVTYLLASLGGLCVFVLRLSVDTRTAPAMFQVVMLTASCLILALGGLGPIARYAHYDRLRQGLGYVDAARRAWLLRGDAARLVGVVVGYTFVSTALGYAFAALSGIPTGSGLGPAALRLFAGEFSRQSVGALSAIVLQCGLRAAFVLVGAVLIGQFSVAAYGSQRESDEELA